LISAGRVLFAKTLCAPARAIPFKFLRGSLCPSKCVPNETHANAPHMAIYTRRAHGCPSVGTRFTVCPPGIASAAFRISHPLSLAACVPKKDLYSRW
jgi:hypothetical protein